MKRVRVYRNLKHGRKARPLYSILYKGRVIARRHCVLLTDVKFIVQPAGRERVLREHCKNVHAFVEGFLVGSRGAFGQDANGPDLPVWLMYNPYVMDKFFIVGEQRTPVNGASGVLLNEHGISACYVEVGA